MRTGHYTRLKGRVTYFRRKIPGFLQARLESTEICCRIGVVSSRLAERLGRRLAVDVDMFFEDAKSNPMLNAANLTQLVETATLGWRETAHADIAEDVHRFGKALANPRESATTMAEMGMALIQRSGTGASAFDASFVIETAEKAGLPAITDDVALTAGGRALSMGLAAHYLRSAVTVASMHGLSKGWRGLPVADWQGRLESLEQHLGLDDQNPTSLSAQPKPRSTPPNLVAEERAPPAPQHAPDVIDAALVPPEVAVSFSLLVDTYLDTRIDTNEVKPGLRQEMASSLKIWLQVVGDKPIGEYQRIDFVNFRSALQKVPKIYWRSDASRKLSILEIIDVARETAIEGWTRTATTEERDDIALVEKAGRDYTRIANVTINRHLSTITPVFEWATLNGHLPDDGRPFWDRLHTKTVSRLQASRQTRSARPIPMTRFLR